MPDTFGKNLASWNVTDFEKHARSVSWYIGFGIMGIILLVYAIWTINYLFAIIIIVTAFIVYVQERSEPVNLKVMITTKGVKIGKKEISYKDISMFWILYDPPHVKKLYFSFKNVMSTELMVPLGSQNPLKIRDILLQFLEEDVAKEEEPLSEVFGRVAKF
jgi:hypothetical protein